ncbi:PIN domain-containing protein [Larkinella sp. VNQ87]|uniref:PIN domain-containing protein n=1 Tax=Larkinella sp. VNQ87 TaxID=3400921 RepID=UPI003C0E071F
MTAQELRSKEGLLIDTNLLVLYVIGLLDTNRIGQNKRTRTYSKEDFNLLVNFTGFFKKVITTTNILTEVSNLLEGEEYHKKPVLSVLPQLLEVIEEHHLPSRSLMVSSNRFFTKFGLSDTVSMELSTRDYTVLTDDLDLCYYLQNNGLSAYNFNHLRTAYLLRP